MKVSEIVLATGGTLCSGPARNEAEGVSTDTRALTPANVFVALSGKNYDANDFLPEAISAGAAVIVCHRGRGPSTDSVSIVEVDDTLRALGDIAHHHRNAFDIPLIAVTGSNGKTTTKEMIRSILETAYGPDAVLANEGNLNNLIGLPLTLCKLAPQHRVGVVELGMNAPGEIQRLAEIARPNVGLITCVGAAHLAGLGSIEGVAKAKGELYAALPDTAVAVVNLADEWVVRQASRFRGRRITFGKGGDFQAEAVVPISMGASRFELTGQGFSHAVELPLGGYHNVSNALAAAAATAAIGIACDLIAEGLTRMKPPPMRLAYEKLVNGVQLVNDCYNANPSSLSAALATMAETAGDRRIVVLGDMLELGADSTALHVRAGHAVALLEPVLLCVVGDFAQDVAAGARDGGMEDGIVIASSHDAAAQAVAAVWKSGDDLLVKGSRGAAMEKVVEALREKARP